MEELRKHLNIREVTVEESMAELRALIAEYEQRYGCSSREMARRSPAAKPTIRGT